MLYSYALYGFWIIHPVLGALFWKKSHPIAAFGVCAGGATTILLILKISYL
jgi:SSS family solute:Na+ symporter